MWKDNFNLNFIVVISGLVYLMLFVTCEPVCYTKISLDERNRHIKRVDCNDTDAICWRFASRKDVKVGDLLNSRCAYPDTVIRVTCSTTKLPIVTEGTFDCDPQSDVSKGEVCILTCDDGFYPASSSQAVCEAGTSDQGGVWSKGSFECRAITCSNINLPTVTNGSFDCAPISDVSKVEACNLICNEGFYPANSNRTVCEPGLTNQGGVWSEGSFVCLAISCQKADLPTVNAGFFNCSGNSVGNKCNLVCDDGYYPSLSKKTVCEENTDNKANWTAGNFQCTAITCQQADLPTVNAGFFNCSGNSVGKKCNLTCDDGFYPSLSKETICEENIDNKANWTGGNFQCTAITCQEADLPTVNAGFFNCSGNSVGNKCNLTCDDGFYPYLSKETVCEENIDNKANWTAGNFQCTSITCQEADLPTVNAGFFNCSGNSVGKKCNLTCDDGFYPSLSKETVCEENIDNKANWTAGNFQCTAITCQEADLPTVNAGFFNCSGYSVGNKCNLTCDYGYFPSSSKKTVCEEIIDNKANWTAGNFRCTAITCQKADIPTVNAGVFNCSGNSVGNKCNLTCDDGYYPSLSKETVCEENIDNKANWSTGIFQCTAITCSTTDLPTVANGSFDCAIKSNVLMGESCALTCNDELYPAFSDHAVCEAGTSNQVGAWSNGSFVCRGLECNNMNQWNGGEYRYISTMQPWEESRQLCENSSSHLVTIDNKDKNEFVCKLAWLCQSNGNYMAWMGLNDIDPQGTWKWTDGTVSTYRNWVGGEPNRGSAQNCGYMSGRYGDWYDVSCNHPLPAVCERNNSLT